MVSKENNVLRSLLNSFMACVFAKSLLPCALNCPSSEQAASWRREIGFFNTPAAMGCGLKLNVSQSVIYVGLWLFSFCNISCIAEKEGEEMDFCHFKFVLSNQQLGYPVQFFASHPVVLLSFSSRFIVVR